MGVLFISREQLASSLGYIIFFCIVLAISFFLSRIASSLIKRYAKRQDDPDALMRFTFLRRMVSAIILLFGVGFAIYFIPSLRQLAISLFAGAGILAIVIGFASQKSLSNVVSGMFITIYKPYRIGDTIAVNDMVGVVEDINFRHTVIRNFENIRVIIPNGIIADAAIENRNLISTDIRKHINVSISYESNVDKAKEILSRLCGEHPLSLDTRSQEDIENGVLKVPVLVTELLDSGVNLRAYVWTNSPLNAWRLSCDVHEQVLKEFRANNIEIPYPHRTVVQKK